MKILRREQHHAQRAEDVASPPVGDPPSRARLALPGSIAISTSSSRASCTTDARMIAAEPDPYQWRIDGHPVRGQSRDIGQRLDEVGLADSVRPDQHVRPRLDPTTTCG